jgi:DNA-binding NarL/FixJ family response regulator
MVRILIADDHVVVRHGIKALLQHHEGWQVCGEATDGRQAVQMAKQLKPDIIVMDIGMPSLNGLEAARLILREDPEQKIVISTVNDSKQVIRAVLEAGARGYILKSDAALDLVSAIEALSRNTTFFTQSVAQMVLDEYLNGRSAEPLIDGPDSSLTQREREIVQLMAEGKCSKEIATMLDISVKTAETHRSNLMHKLGLHSVVEVVLFAIRHQIVQVEMPPPAFSRSAA